MKPELVTIGTGRHNERIEESFQRVLEGATWKHQRIVVVMPAARNIPTKVALSHWSVIFPPNQACYRMLALGHEVGDAYNNAIGEIIGHPELSQWEYVLTIEHDNVPQPDGLLRLVKAMDARPEFSCIGGLYWTKGEGGVPQIWGDPRDPVMNFRPQPPQPGEIVECNGTGMGFNLWRMDVFKDERLRRPWFKTATDGGGVSTQDLYFWENARKYGHRCAVDCSTLVGHWDSVNEVCW